ncbi:MAG: S41 family peptidase, partial [Myxococcota bacterium]
DFADGTCEANEPAEFVRVVSESWYLYPDQLPTLDVPEGPSRPYLQELVENVDLAPDSPDLFAEDRFSFVTTVSSFTASSTGNFVGIGIQYRLEGEDGARFIRLQDVLGSGPREDPTPAGEGGLERADKIIGINGEAVSSIIANRGDEISELGAVSQAFGSGEEGEEVGLEIEKPDGTTFSVTLARRPIEQNEVPVAEVLDVGDESIGYMVFRGFTPSSPDELAAAIAEFESQSIEKLIIDLRYNGGGLIDVAAYFGNLLAGPAQEGTVFVRTVLNPEQAERSSEQLFGTPRCPVDDCDVTPEPLSNLQEIVFITTGSTASSSEILINGMRAVLPVRVVGSPTFGKPVGFFAFTHEDCDQVYGPVSLKSVNADGNGDYFGGFEVDCPASDDLTRLFADPEEESLAAAISLLTTDSCPSAAMSLRSLRLDSRPARFSDVIGRDSWQ